MRWAGALGTSDSALSELALGVVGMSEGEGTSVVADVATGTGAAHNATVQTSTAQPGVATGAGTAYDAGARQSTGWLPGDIAVAMLMTNVNSASSPPTGWTQIGSAVNSNAGSGSSVSAVAAYRVLQDGDLDTGAWTMGGSPTAWRGSLAIYRGQHGTPIGTTSGATAVGSATVTWAAIGSTVDSASWVLALLFANADVTLTPAPSGMTFREGIGGVDETAIWDTNAGVSSWAGDTQTYSGIGLHARMTIELRAATTISFITSASSSGTSAPGVIDLPTQGIGPYASATAATGSGTAAAASAIVAPNAGLASGTGAALDATASTSISANAELASGTGSASGPSPAIAPNAEAGSGSGSAGDATAAATGYASAGAATGSGAAQGASPSVAPNAGAGAGSGSASDATGTVSSPASADAATGTGAAAGATPSVLPSAGAGAGSGSASNATVSTTAGSVSVNAGLASGTGSAQNAAAKVGPARLYLNTRGWPQVRPVVNSGWENANLALELWHSRRMMRTWHGGSEELNPFGIDNQAAIHDLLMAQYISEPLAAQTINGTIRAVVQASENNASANMRSQMHAWVMAPDGSVRGTLTTFTTGGLSSEWNTSRRSAFFPVGSTGTAVTSTAILDGDRVVVDLGARIHDTSATVYDGRLFLGDGKFSSPGTSWDLPSDQTNTTTTRNGWVEFSTGLVFLATPVAIEDDIADAVDCMPDAESSVTAYAADVSGFTTEADDPDSMSDVNYSNDLGFTGWTKLVGPTGGARVRIEGGGGLGIEPFIYVFDDPPTSGSAYESYQETFDFNTGPLFVDVPDGVTKYVAIMPGDGSFEIFDVGDENVYLVFSRARAGDIPDLIADAPDLLPATENSDTVAFSPDIDFWTTETDDPDYIADWWVGDPAAYTGWFKLDVPVGPGTKVVDIDTYLPIDYAEGPEDTVLLVFDEVPTASSMPIAEMWGNTDVAPPAGSIDQSWSSKAKIVDLELHSGSTYYVCVFPINGSSWEHWVEGTNLQITVHRQTDSPDVDVFPEVASGTGQAYDAPLSLTTAEIATGTGQAYDAYVNPAVAEVATGSGSAFGATPLVAPHAGTGTGSGTAHQVLFVEVARGTGAAYDAAIYAEDNYGAVVEGDIATGYMPPLAAPIDDDDTTIIVQYPSTTNPDVPFVVIIDGEQVLVTNVSGTTWTVVRGYDGTTATSHGAGSVARPALVRIRVGGVLISADVDYRRSRFTTGANGQAGTAEIWVRDLDRTRAFVTGAEVIVKFRGVRVWGGYLASIRRQYVFPYGTGRIGDEPRWLLLDCVDYNVLFNKRIYFKPGDADRMAVKHWANGTRDSVVIDDLVHNYLTLGGDGLRYDIHHVGTPALPQISCNPDAPDVFGIGSAGWTWGQVMQAITSQTGAVYYIDPDKTFRYVDDSTKQSRFGWDGLSDAPDNVNTIGYRDVEFTLDASKMTNDHLQWGAGQGRDEMVFSRTIDDDSVEDHGLWQTAEVRFDMYCQESVDQRGETWVYGSPQNRRGGKDDRFFSRVTVREPYFRVADVVELESVSFDFTEIAPVRNAEITFPTPWDIRNVLTIAHEIDAPWSTFEFWMPQFDFDIGGLRGPRLPELPELPDPWGTFDPCDPVGDTECVDEIAGWAGAEGGGTWDRVESSSYDLGSVPSGGIGTIKNTLAASGFVDVYYGGRVWLSGRTLTSPVGYYVQWTLVSKGPSSTTGINAFEIGYATVDDTGAARRLRMVWNAPAPPTNYWQLIGASPGGGQNSFTWTEGAQYHTKIEMPSAGSVRVKIWADGDAEPIGWDETGTYAGANGLMFEVPTTSWPGGTASPENEVVVTSLSIYDPDEGPCGVPGDDYMGEVLGLPGFGQPVVGWHGETGSWTEYDYVIGGVKHFTDPINASMSGGQGTLTSYLQDVNNGVGAVVLNLGPPFDPNENHSVLMAVTILDPGKEWALQLDVAGNPGGPGEPYTDYHASGTKLLDVINTPPGEYLWRVGVKTDGTVFSRWWALGDFEPVFTNTIFRGGGLAASPVPRIVQIWLRNDSNSIPVDVAQVHITSIEVNGYTDTSNCADAFDRGGLIAGWGSPDAFPGGTWAILEDVYASQPAAFEGNGIREGIYASGVNDLYYGGVTYLSGADFDDVHAFLVTFVVSPMNPSDNSSSNNTFRIAYASPPDEVDSPLFGFTDHMVVFWNNNIAPFEGYSVLGVGNFTRNIEEGVMYAARFRVDQTAGTAGFKFWEPEVEDEPASYSSAPNLAVDAVVTIKISLDGGNVWPAGTRPEVNGVTYWVGYGEDASVPVAVGDGCTDCADAAPGEFEDPLHDGPNVGEGADSDFEVGDNGGIIFHTDEQFQVGSTEVWVNGLRIRIGSDYIEYPRQAMIEILDHVDVGTVGAQATVTVNYVVWTIDDPMLE